MQIKIGGIILKQLKNVKKGDTLLINPVGITPDINGVQMPVGQVIIALKAVKGSGIICSVPGFGLRIIKSNFLLKVDKR